MYEVLSDVKVNRNPVLVLYLIRPLVATADAAAALVVVSLPPVSSTLALIVQEPYTPRASTCHRKSED